MINYSDYLQLATILNAQHTESEKLRLPAHDETLFIIIHQAYELWFKQLLHETESIAVILDKPSLNDNSPELQTVVHRLSRMSTILKVLVHQIDIMETMTPMDFLDFRDMLRPASGFQSWQFKMLEARLGLKFSQRHGQEYYTSQLTPEHIQLIKEAESKPTILELVNTWLNRMPFVQQQTESFHPDSFWKEYRDAYAASLSEAEQKNLDQFDQYFFKEETEGSALTLKARRAAHFIMLYRGYPLLHLPYELISYLLEIDEQLSIWRYRHMSMVQRMIGSRVGTGGSSGKDYLAGAVQKHSIFGEFSRLTSFLLNRRNIPTLPPAMEKYLGFYS